ncbi:hypothetical protein CAPTEDRAFT_171446 [Capitella teleta]|uniref:Threonylcarbamoyl-AMP synthase n=1 Tax=Capitella teleta TaxID=283909 RepID=R7UGX9_CAPTE|nr:hypothetical protein CAPTEDRAFT_171446 [Capitella teleta]|eukprot:ELU02517.1 hypothetical protein CAPTEDRAFT_171446 [Capitella teleta]
MNPLRLRCFTPKHLFEKTLSVYSSAAMSPHIDKIGKILTDSSSLICRACQALQEEGIIAVPTDTIYGIAGLAQSPNAVLSLYQTKGRASTNPMSICVADIEDIYKWGKVTISQSLLTQLLPGPVTVVFQRTPELNPQLNPGVPLVGIRIPNYNFVRNICRSAGGPLALTSANKSGGLSPLNIEEFRDLWSNLSVICDGGTLAMSEKDRLGSTVVDLSSKGHYRIIRSGSAEKETVGLLVENGLSKS